ncbi:hypothetical protein OIU84_025019 [Salix udensis]|uniref:Uncharacterized protein n=1 Tax=Salix udensis TaxID=889485 RepID=A0AAD6PBC6_9ROSI|nr:hypothetical protein OIU84_025019 [Salix udensis]
MLGSIYDDKGGCKDEEETKSSANRSRKSFSIFAIERGFLKWVLGSNDKERYSNREREPVHNGRKNVSDLPKMEKEPEAASAVQEAKHLMTVMDEAAGNGKENVKEDNILYFQEPPSFRIYCVHNVSVDGDSNEGSLQNLIFTISPLWAGISEPGSGKKKKRKIQDCMTKW